MSNASLSVYAVGTWRKTGKKAPTLLANYGANPPGAELVALRNASGALARDINSKVLDAKSPVPVGSHLLTVVLDGGKGTLTAGLEGWSTTASKTVKGAFNPTSSFAKGEPPLIGAQGLAGKSAAPNSDTFWSGDLHEMIVFDRVLSGAEAATVNSWLKMRWWPCGGCDDKNACTADSCSLATKKCTHKPIAGVCFAGNKCIVGDVCAAGVCKAGSTAKCDDGNVCTADSCTAATGACAHETKKDGSTCSDGTACTAKDACKAGKCVGVTINCNDDNPCTTDACNSQVGCTNVPNAAPCNDGNACTAADACTAGKCTGKAVSCNDYDGCTKDTCDPKTGCKHSKSLGPCVKPPYFQPFNCGDKSLLDWHLTGPLHGMAWGYDATPKDPGYFSKGCSLNYNNGKNLSCYGRGGATAWASSPYIDATGVDVGQLLRVQFRLAGKWQAIGPPWDIFAVLNLLLYVEEVGGPLHHLGIYFPGKGWSLETVKLGKFAGKVFRIRFRYRVQCVSNMTGPFIDDFRVFVLCGDVKNCNDGNPCTVDSCDKTKGCQHTPKAGCG